MQDRCKLHIYTNNICKIKDFKDNINLKANKHIIMMCINLINPIRIDVIATLCIVTTSRAAGNTFNGVCCVLE